MFLDNSDADFYIMIDADDTYDIENINDAIKRMKDGDYDMMVAKRVHSDPTAYRKGHVFGNKIFSKSVNIIFGNDITDIFSGFRIFQKDSLKHFHKVQKNLK